MTTSRRAVIRSIWAGLSACLAVAVAAGGWAFVRGGAHGDAAQGVLSEPGDYGQVPDFELVDRTGRTITRQDLAGDFWIADFIFTRCTGICPTLTARMAWLKSSLGETPAAGRVRFVSFTVDPAWDTPDVLRRYAAAAAPAAADTRGWLFLSGPSERIHRLVGEGFHLSVASGGPGSSPGDLITHSDRLVLVDPDGRIRAYYRGGDEDSVDKLADDLLRLLEPHRPL